MIDRPELKPADSGHYGSSLASLYAERARRDSSHARRWGGLVLGALCIAGGVLVWRSTGRFVPWIALVLGCAGACCVAIACRTQRSRHLFWILGSSMALCWALGVLQLMELDRISGVYYLVHMAALVLIAMILRRAFRQAPPRVRGTPGPGITMDEVTSVPVGPSAADRWRRKIEEEHSEDQRWERKAQLWMPGGIALCCGVFALSLAFDTRERVIVLAIGSVFLALFLWSFFAPRPAWIVARGLLGAGYLAVAIAMVLEDRLGLRIAGGFGVLVLGHWAYRKLNERRARRRAPRGEPGD